MFNICKYIKKVIKIWIRNCFKLLRFKKRKNFSKWKLLTEIKNTNLIEDATGEKIIELENISEKDDLEFNTETKK